MPRFMMRFGLLLLMLLALWHCCAHAKDVKPTVSQAGSRPSEVKTPAKTAESAKTRKSPQEKPGDTKGGLTGHTQRKEEAAAKPSKPSTMKTEKPAKPPNVVIFLADDLGMGDLGCFGNDTIRTPNIDAMARQGVRLTHHLTAAAICTPSRAALLTGRYPIRMGMTPSALFRVNLYTSSVSGLPPNETTFAELVKRKGYTTAAIGKWHLGLHCDLTRDFCHHPMKQGFDQFYGIPLTNLKDFGDDGLRLTRSRFPLVDSITLAVALGGALLLFYFYRMRFIAKGLFLALLCFLMLANFIWVWAYNNHKILNSIAMRDYRVVEQPIRWQGFTQRLVTEGQEFLEARAEDGKPFLLYLPWTQVHTVLHASQKFRGQSKHGQYGDDVEELDWSVGQILDTLRRLGMKDNTFVYFSSDNGGHSEEMGVNGQLEGGYNGIYKGGKSQGGMEGGIRVPTVAMWPGRIPASTEVDLPTSQMDIFPTIASLMGIPLPTDRVIDGRNLLPTLTGENKAPLHEFLIHYCLHHIHAARYTPTDGTGVWKAHFITPDFLPGVEHCGSYVCPCSGWGTTTHDPPLLYNIAKDPSEKTPLDTSDPKHRDIVRKIEGAIEEHKASIETVPSQFDLLKLLPRYLLQPCCGGGFFPWCNCTDGRYVNVH